MELVGRCLELSCLRLLSSGSRCTDGGLATHQVTRGEAAVTGSMGPWQCTPSGSTWSCALAFPSGGSQGVASHGSKVSGSTCHIPSFCMLCREAIYVPS